MRLRTTIVDRDIRPFRLLTRYSVLRHGYCGIRDAIARFDRQPWRIRRFDSPVLPRFRRGDRALSIVIVRCGCETLISTGIAHDGKYSGEYLGV